MKYSVVIDRLQNLKKRKISQAELQGILNLKQSTISNRQNRDSQFSDEEIKTLEQHFNVILGDEYDCIEVEHVFLNPSCGYGTSQEDEADRIPIKLGTSLVSDVLKVSNPSMLKTFTASGDSMSPIIEHGDLILVDTGDVEYTNGGVFLITINNDWFIKRLRKKITGELDIISDNPKYPIETLDTTTFKDVLIKGRILKNLSRGL